MGHNSIIPNITLLFFFFLFRLRERTERPSTPRVGEENEHGSSNLLLISKTGPRSIRKVTKSARTIARHNSIVSHSPFPRLENVSEKRDKHRRIRLKEKERRNGRREREEIREFIRIGPMQERREGGGGMVWKFSTIWSMTVRGRGKKYIYRVRARR